MYDNKQQGPMVMTRTTTTPQPIIPRNEVTENKRSTMVTTTTHNILVNRFENIFNKFLK